jgi:Carboxypeptidase regulatory-like domain/TonB dependent receptor-like, beta-barrel
MTSLFIRAVFLTIVSLTIAVSSVAQTSRATIRGIVLDQTGARLPGVQLRVTKEDTNESRQVVSDDQGNFAFAELDAGRYSIEAQRTGFTVYRHRAHLVVGQELWLEPQLTVSATATVTTGGAELREPLLERNSPAMTTLITEEQVLNLPLDGRNFLELALLSPGTVPAPQGSASSVRGDFAFITNGAREDFNNYILDGVYNVDPKLNTPAVRPPVDGIHEFKVLTSTYDASFGRNAAGQVNVLTRSGSNMLSGTAFEFVRNGGLDSRNFFAPNGEPDPEYSRHQFGGTVGGPVARNRTFFFADYERTRLREGITRVTNVPTAQERTGNFSQSLFARPVDPLSHQPLPGGQIPSFFLNPIGLAIASLYPLPNRTTPFANFVSSPTLRDDIHQFDGKVEHSLTPSMRLGVRYSFSDRALLEPFAGPGFSSLPGFGNDVARRGQNLGITLTHASSAWVNDVRFGYNRVSIGVFPESATTTNATVGLQTLATNPRDAGLSLITIAGYSPLGHEYNNPQESTADTFQIADTATLASGSHLIKVGGEWYGLRQSAFRDVQARGFLTFVQQGYTGNALADLLLGLPVLTGGARLDNPQNLRATNWSVFAHDDWRAARKLTISAGLRYDYISPPCDRDNRANLYDLSTGSLVQVGTNGMPRGGFEPDRNNFAPRGGLAWTLDSEDRWVVRGGYGIYYNQGALATAEGLYFNPPYFNLSVYFPDPNLPPLTLANPFPSTFPIYIPQSATAYQRDLQTPWMEHWNVNLQHQLGYGRAIEAGYVASRGHDLISARDANQPPASPSPLNLRPNPLFADITLIESRASSRYNAMQIKYLQRMEQGLSYIVSYTYGKSTDDASGFFTSAGDANFPQNSLDPGAERGRSSFDVRHRTSLALTYALPFAGNAWLNDWQVQAVGTLQSGRPFTVAIHPDIDVSNTGRSNLGFGYNDRPNVTGDPNLPANKRNEDAWFNTAAFSFPPFGTFGNSGRNTVEGPGYKNLNLAVVKLVPIAEARLQLRFEMFNVFNNTNFDLPDPFLGSPTFGKILSAGSPRRIQFGVRAMF